MVLGIWKLIGLSIHLIDGRTFYYSRYNIENETRMSQIELINIIFSLTKFRLMDNNNSQMGFTPYEQVRIGHMQSKRPSGVAIIGYASISSSTI